MNNRFRVYSTPGRKTREYTHTNGKLVGKTFSLPEAKRIADEQPATHTTVVWDQKYARVVRLV